MSKLLTIGIGLAVALAVSPDAQAQLRSRRGTPIVSLPAGAHVGPAFPLRTAVRVPSDGILVFDGRRFVTRRRLVLARPLFPIVLFGVPFFSTPAQVILVQPPPVIIMQQEPTAERAERVRHAGQQVKAEPTNPPEPAREIGEFILVRRDGTVLSAVAFSAQPERIVYVTREGIRRSLPLADLDVNATLRMNEERGTTLHLPC